MVKLTKKESPEFYNLPSFYLDSVEIVEIMQNHSSVESSERFSPSNPIFAINREIRIAFKKWYTHVSRCVL